MPTLKDILDQALAESGFGTYSTYVTNSDPEVRQIVAVLNRSASKIARYDWERLRKPTTIDLTTDDLGGNTYAKPADFLFYRPDTAYKQQSIQWVDLPTNDGFWAYLKANNSPQGVVLKARFEAGLIYIHDPGGLSNIVRYEYTSKYPIAAAATPTVGSKERFTADDDEWLLDQSLIEMDFIWRWKKKQGIEDWEVDRSDFLTYEATVKGDDSGSKTLIDGSMPGTVQTPADSPQANLYV